MAQKPTPDMSGTTQGNLRVVTPSGRLDHSQAPAFESGLIEQTQHAINAKAHLVIDLHAVDFVSSIILKVIRAQKDQLLKHDLSLALCSPNPVVREILQITQFHFVAGLHDCVNDAADALAQTN